MKKSIVILLMLVSSLLSAQSSYQDVVYLKNGSIIRGVIIEQIPNRQLKIETSDRNVFVYTMDEIEKIAKESTPRKNTGKSKGYRGVIEMGYSIGVGERAIDRISVNFINGYQLNPNISAGIGLGVRQYLDAASTLIPLFLDIRADIIRTKVTPYVSFIAGYTFDVSNRHKFIEPALKMQLGSKSSGIKGVGFIINPSIGVDFYVAPGKSMNLGVGYESQNIEIDEANYGTISICLGFSF